MAKELRFDGRVAIVTGAGNGLGRSHALLLGSRGAKVVVNDLGGGIHGAGKSAGPADLVVAAIKEAGGDAVANYNSVEDGDKIVKTAVDAFGKVDIIVNNAGILRDTTFHKMSEEDWDLIYRVHVLGGMRVTRAAWEQMRESIGRIVFTASAAGIYGNFGQANYAMAKLGLVGLSNTLALEGQKRNILVNTIAPIAGSRLTETVMPADLIEALQPEAVSPLIAALCHESSKETGGLFEVGGGFFSKLRWQRTEGKTYLLGRNITPELLTNDWGEITDFEKPTYPTNINESLQPIVNNLGSKSRGGNEFIDCDAALGFEFPELKSEYTKHDLAIYALGIGAAKDPSDMSDLKFVYEMHSDGFQAIPSYACVPAVNAILEQAKQGKQAPGMNYGFDRILHGEQYTEVFRPLPGDAKLTHKTRVKDIFDKGKNAIVIMEIETSDEDGPLCKNEVSTLVRGAGGWGGDRGPSGPINEPPTRKADKIVEQKIDDNQALLYRLSGDWNPLHADPSFAKAFGFERPILHGLCTFGYATRHVIREFSDNDARLFKSIRCRFADSVFPGETLITEMWKDGNKITLRCTVKERDKVVLSNAAIELYDEIPKPKAKPKAAAPTAAAEAPAAAAAGPNTASIMAGMAFYIEQNPSLVKQVSTVYQFNIKKPDSNWVLDLKNGAGSLKEGTAEAECVLELSDEDWIGMATGQLNPQKLYFGGKLKVKGNVMASQKLEFMQKIDGDKLMADMKAAGRLPEAGATAPAASGGGDSDTLSSADIFAAIGDYIGKHPELVKQVSTVYLFKLTNPDSAWTVDLKEGGVKAGDVGGAECTLTLSSEDFMKMTSGEADPQKLYFGGKLKVAGNVMASQKLMFLKEIDPEQAKEAIAKARAAGGGGAAAASEASSGGGGALGAKFFEALKARVEKDGSIAKEVQASLQFVVTEPDAKFVVDLTSSGKVSEGAGKADATLTLNDEDLAALSKGEAQDLFQRGQLRIDGEMRVASKLGFLKGLL